MTPAQFRTRMAMLTRTLLPTLGQELGTVVFSRWAAAQTLHMRDAKGEPVRRSPSDTGPLRIVTGDYVKTGARGGIREITTHGLSLRMRKGADPQVTPQVYNETGTRYAPARPTLQPALEDILKAGTRSIIQRRFHAALRRAVR